MSIFKTIARFFGGSGSPAAAPASAAQTARRTPGPPPPRNTPAGKRMMNAQGSAFAKAEIPAAADIAVNLSDCAQLRDLPDGIHTGSLSLARCTGLTRLPAGMDVAFLDLSGCTALTALPDDLNMRGGRLNLSGCGSLKALPENLGEVAVLDLSGCSGIADLPPGLVVTSWIDVAGSGIQELPELYDPVGVRWNGVPVSRQIAFDPQSITPADIAKEANPKVRAVMEERAR